MMRFKILTLFPEMFAALDESMLGRARKNGIIDIDIINIRDFSRDKHKKTDDTPFGGGHGMVMMPDPLFRALDSAGAESKHLIYMSPRGRVLDEKKIEEIAGEEEVIILAGHYEGVDQRVLDRFGAEEISIGDYVLTGGELPAMVLVDAVSRMIPGVIAKEEAVKEESIYSGLLEYPQYSQPREYEGLDVPEVLLSGDHEKIRLWKFEESLRLTRDRRRDLFDAFVKRAETLSKKERKILEKVLNEDS